MAKHVLAVGRIKARGTLDVRTNIIPTITPESVAAAREAEPRIFQLADMDPDDRDKFLAESGDPDLI